MHSAFEGNSEEVAKLIDDGAAVDWVAAAGRNGSTGTALHCASRRGHEETVKVLLQVLACSMRFTVPIVTLTSAACLRRCDRSWRQNTFARGEYLLTALCFVVHDHAHQAISSGYINVVALLLQVRQSHAITNCTNEMCDACNRPEPVLISAVNK